MPCRLDRSAGAAPSPLAGIAPMIGQHDRLQDIREKPLLRPRIVAEPVPTLVVVDAAGRSRAYALGERGLAELALSIAEAQAVLARSKIESLQACDL